MKKVTIKFLAFLLASIMLLSCFVACGEVVEPSGSEQATNPSDSGEANTEGGTVDEAAQALDLLGTVDYGQNEFVILHGELYKSEIWGESGVVDKENGGDQLINDAVYERNTLLEDKCNLVFGHLERTSAAMQSSVA